MGNDSQCAICKQPVKRAAPGLQCAGECRKFFHASCAQISKDILSSVSAQHIDWFCSSCKTKKRKSFVVQDCVTPTTPNTNETTAFNNFMLSIKADINDFKNKQSEMLESITFISNSFDQINTKLEKLEKQGDKIDAIIHENETLKKIVHEQSIRLTALEQQPYANSIEISGVPDIDELQPIDAVKIIAEAISFDYDASNVKSCKRSKFAPKGKSKNIIVDFNSQLTKDTFLSAKKKQQINSSLFVKYNTGTSTTLTSNSFTTGIYINEMLCPANKKLLFNTKIFAKNNNFKYVWVRDGIIFIRKNDNQRYFAIKDIADLNNVILYTNNQ